MPQYSFPFERDAISAAKDGALMPDGLTITDQLAFQALAQLYGRYYTKLIGKDDASREKMRIKAAWEKRKKLDAFDEKLLAHRASVILKIEKCSREFLGAKNAADALSIAKKMLEIWDNIPLELSREVLEELKNAD